MSAKYFRGKYNTQSPNWLLTKYSILIGSLFPSVKLTADIISPLISKQYFAAVQPHISFYIAS